MRPIIMILYEMYIDISDTQIARIRIETFVRGNSQHITALPMLAQMDAASE